MNVATAVSSVTTRSAPRPRYAAFESCFAPEPISVGLSRHTSRVFLRLCGVADPLTESVVLCISELVTNGVTHGVGDVSLRVRWCTTEIRVEVIDGSSVPATMRLASADATSGRGLGLVEALSEDWGASNDGRTTWCTFRIPAGSAR
ncbi:ATP-binding protein [Streptomyces niveus]|uniref:ATP-binding protein n=1 Tax=Streptomyces niveus TaxID=193462 RepID=UPI0035E10699